MALTCVHFQDAHNLVKTNVPQRCPWCYADALEARLRKAEALLADAVTLWDARGAGYWREQILRHAQYQDFINAGKP